jgi:Flp pilus assembly protein TadG
MIKKSEKGQAMVEFALVLIPLLIIIGGIIDFGWIFYHKVMINNAAREGARYAAINPADEASTINLINNRLPDTFVKSTGYPKVVKDSPTTGDVTVIINGDIDILTPLLSAVFTDSNPSEPGVQFNMTSQTIMKME